MQIAGIIAEYNPFHNGHAYQIEQVRAQGFDAVVCVMSPGLVQRGEPALFPADVRASAALRCGADVVLCLPAPCAASSAQMFAAAGVRALDALGCVQALCYGAETPNAGLHVRAAAALMEPKMETALRAYLQQGMPFAPARQQALEDICPGTGKLLGAPNDILAVEYCRAILEQKSTMQPMALARRGAAHGAPLSDAGTGKTFGSLRAARQAAGFASGTALRSLVEEQGVPALEPYVPKAALEVYLRAARKGEVWNRQAFSTALLCRLRAGYAQGFASVRGAGEGLENRLSAAVRQARTDAELLELLKTKRYATARLRRFALDAALKVPQTLPEMSYLHVLGASKTGLAVLRKAKKTARLPLSSSLSVLEKFSSQAADMAALHAAAEDFAALCLISPRPMGTAYTQKFILPEEGDTIWTQMGSNRNQNAL